MGKSKTNLNYLMSLCNIRGVEISGYLHVDQSLIGKWKNGTRAIPANSGYLDSLAKLFLDKSKEKIEALLKDVYKSEYKEEELDKFLKAFICSEDPEIMVKTVMHKDLDADESNTYYAYNGVSGRKKAMDYFLDYANNIRTTVTLYLYDSTSFDWLIKDREYFKTWGHKISSLVEKGNDIYVIIEMGTQKERAATLLYHLYPFSVNRRFNIYYAENVNYPTTYVMGGMMAITGYNDEVEKNFCTQLFIDHTAVSQQEFYIRRLLRSRIKESVRRLDADKCFQNIKNLNFVNSDIYMFSSMPTIYSMPKELMEKVLSYNDGLDEIQKQKLREFNSLSRSEFFGTDRGLVRCMFPLEEIMSAAKREEIIYSDNLYKDSVRVIVKNEDFREHLKYLADVMEKKENYEIGLVPDIKNFNTEIEKLGYFACKERCWTMISNEHSGAKAMFFMNPSLVELIFKAQEYVWNSIPRSYTHKDNTLDIIRTIISQREGM